MEFLKKNYEKILLGAVLLGLAVLVVVLFLWVGNEKQKLEQRTSTFITRTTKPAPPLNLDYYDEVLQKMKTPPVLDLSMTNRLFNPVKWQKAPDGKLIKIVRGDEIGPRAVVVTNITALYMTIALDSVSTNDPVPRYAISVDREGAPTLALRKKRYFVSFPISGNNNKSEVFTLNDAKGPVDDPELTLTLTDTGEKIQISKAKPFKRADAYTADLKYDPEKRVFKNCRVGSVIAFDGEEYNIVAISENEVVISAKSNNKKTTITYAAP
jgi:hypothetical protein